MTLLRDTARPSSGGFIHTFGVPTPEQTPQASPRSTPALDVRADALAPPFDDFDDCDVALPPAWPTICTSARSAPNPAADAFLSPVRPPSMRDIREPHLPTAFEHGVVGLSFGMAVGVGRLLQAPAPEALCTAGLVVMAASLTAVHVFGDHAGYEHRFGTLSPHGTLQVATGYLVTGLLAEGWQHL